MDAAISTTRPNASDRDDRWPGRPHPALVELAAGRPFPAVLDESSLVRSAREHRMTGLLLSELRRSAQGGADPAALEAADAETQRRHRGLWTALETAVARAREIGVELATLKGVTAEARWFSRLGERPCRDVDLLVAPHDLDRAGEIVECLQPEYPLGRAAQRFIDSGALQATTLTLGDVRIDLHFDPFKLGIPCRGAGLIWDRTLPFDLPGGGTVRVLDAETSLLLYLIHLNKDRFRYLLGYVDVLRALRSPSFDVAFVTRYLEAEGLLDPMSLALRAVGRDLGVPVPSLPPSKRLAAAVWETSWRRSIRLRGREARFRYKKRQELLPLLARGRKREAVVHVWRVAFPPRELYEVANPGEEGTYLGRLTLRRPLRFLRTRIKRSR